MLNCSRSTQSELGCASLLLDASNSIALELLSLYYVRRHNALGGCKELLGTTCMDNCLLGLHDRGLCILESLFKLRDELRSTATRRKRTM